jgi:hypothetical protein
MSLIDAWGWEQLCPDEKPKENVKKNKQIKLYGARDKNTGKLVTGLTNPSHKFWHRRKDCEDAINRYKNGRYKRHNYDLELVVYKLVEVEE